MGDNDCSLESTRDTILSGVTGVNGSSYSEQESKLASEQGECNGEEGSHEVAALLMLLLLLEREHGEDRWEEADEGVGDGGMGTKKRYPDRYHSLANALARE